MIYQLPHSKRSPIRVTRRTIEVSALVAGSNVAGDSGGRRDARTGPGGVDSLAFNVVR